jgi:Membrane-bound lytic murein transglycosylase B
MVPGLGHLVISSLCQLQFKNYAIDLNGNNDIELKKIDDSFASAANYMNKIGWKKNKPCFL